MKPLSENNRTDFAHLQTILYQLLLNPEHRKALCNEVRYMLVDEYQDNELRAGTATAYVY